MHKRRNVHAFEKENFVCSVSRCYDRRRALGPALEVSTLPVNAADSSFAGEEWYDQIDKVEENREPAHAYFTPYESAEKALTNEKSVLDVDESESAYKQSLNGTWKFKFAQKPAEREKQAKGADAKNYVENWDTSGWDDIKVPSSIQTIKDADGNFKYEKPIYVNQEISVAEL